MSQSIKKAALLCSLIYAFFFCAQAGASAQTTVSGKVTDSNGDPIVGAIVWVKQTDNYTSTDSEGKYTLTFKGKLNLVCCAALSYVEQGAAATIGETQTLNFQLESENNVLDDVVVVGMNNRQSKRSITGAISTVSSEDLLKSPVGNISNSLAGKVPGLVTLQTSGEPGSDAASLYIRGMGTYGVTTPLVVIDGFPSTKGDLDGLDANEIESITVLKDASSSSLYGIQGANGVIVVTTRRGSANMDNKPKISFSMQQALQQPIRLPELMSSYDQAVFYKTQDTNDGRTNITYTDEVMQKLADGSDPYLYPNTDWFGVVLKDLAHQHQYNVNASGTAGKDNKVNYFVSGGYFGQGTLLNHEDEFKQNYGVNSKFDRFNFRSNIDIQATRQLYIRADFSARLQTKVGPYTGFSSIFSQITGRRPSSSAVFNPDGTIAAASALEEYAEPGNPYGLLTRSGYYKNTNNALTGTIMAKYDFSRWVQGLSIQASYNFEYENTVTRQWLQKFDQYLYLGKVGGEDAYSQVSENSNLSCSTGASANRYHYYDLRVNYERQFDKHSVSAQVIANRTLKDLLSSQYQYAYQGISARATYNYANRYFAEFNLGYNGSENFHPDRRYGVFPAGSLGWVISDEKWFNRPDWIKILKLRASYGLVGNDQIGGTRFMYISDFSQGGCNKYWAGYYFGTNTGGFDSSAAKGYNESLVGNEYVTWETAQKLNAGIDVSLFRDNSLAFCVDYFRELRNNILTNAGRVPDYIGIENLSPRNSGSVLNQGVEFEIRFNKRFNSDWSAFATLNGTYAQNVVLENDQPTPAFDYQDLRGYEIGYELGYHAIGFFEDQNDIDSSPAQAWDKLIPGDIKYEDVNKDGVINEDDRIPIRIGALPKFTGNLTLGFNWKGLDFSILMSGATGGTVRLYVYPSSVINTERWTEANKDTRLPVAHTSGNNSQPSDYNVMSTDYFKIRNLELGYTIPNRIMNKAKINNFRVYFNMQNVATWDKLWLKDRDPESAGGATLPYPIQRVFNFGLRFDI